MTWNVVWAIPKWRSGRLHQKIQKHPLVSLGGASWRFACWVAQATRCDWAWWLVVWRSMMMIFCESKRRWRVHCLILSRAELVSFKLFWTMMLQGQHCKEVWREGVKQGDATNSLHEKILPVNEHQKLITSIRWRYVEDAKQLLKEGEARELTGRLKWTETSRLVKDREWGLDLSPRCWWWTSGWTTFHGSKFSQ